MSDNPSGPTDGTPEEPQRIPEVDPAHTPGEIPATHVPAAAPGMTNVEQAAPPPPKPSGLRYAAVAAIVALLAGGAYLVTASDGTSADLNAGSPVEAVEAMIEVIGDGRIIDLMRNEFPWMDEFGSVDETALDSTGLEDGRIGGLVLEGKDLTYDVREIDDQIAIVSITGGSFHAGVKVSELPESIRSTIPGPAAGISYEDDFPVPMIAAGMCQGVKGSCDPSAIQIVTVDDGDGWRASMMHTILYLTTDAVLQPRSAGGAASPEDMEAAMEQAIESGDPNRFLDLLDPAEFSWARDFEFDFDDDTVVSIDLQMSVRDKDSSTAMLHLDRFEGVSKEKDLFTGEVTKERGSFDGDCFYEDSEVSGCLSQLQSVELDGFEAFRPVLDLLATEGINLGLVERSGAWYLSMSQTLEPFTPALEAAGREFQRLAEDCQEVIRGSDQGELRSLPEECAFFAGGLLAPFMATDSYSSSERVELEY